MDVRSASEGRGAGCASSTERPFGRVLTKTRLRDENHLSVRVYPVLTLRTWNSLKDVALAPGSGDDMIGYGALKMFLDGFLMFRPYANNPQYSGSLSFCNIDGAQLNRVVLSKDIRNIAPVELLRTKVLTTVFDGKIVYSAAEVQP